MKRNQWLYTKLAFEVYNNAKICTKCYTIKKICVHHKDENPWNNEESNLQILCLTCHRWEHQNSWMYWKKHTKKAKKKMSINWSRPNLWKKWKDCIFSKKVNQYNLKWEFIKTWDSLTSASKKTKTNINWIWRCCNWKRITSWWYKWEYFKN